MKQYLKEVLHPNVLITVFLAVSFSLLAGQEEIEVEIGHIVVGVLFVLTLIFLLQCWLAHTRQLHTSEHTQ